MSTRSEADMSSEGHRRTPVRNVHLNSPCSAVSDMSTPSQNLQNNDCGLETLTNVATGRSTSPSASPSTTSTDDMGNAFEEEDNLEQYLFGGQQANESDDEEDIEDLLNLTLDWISFDEDVNVDHLPPLGDTGNSGDRFPIMYGAPLGWRPPGKPKDWQRPTPRNGEPQFESVDNPGQ